MHSDLLNSWKEIADYLGRGVRTAQRWEVELHLPVRRDLDQWVRKSGQSAKGAKVTLADVRKTTSILKVHRREMRTLTTQVRYQMHQTLGLLGLRVGF